MLLYFLHHTHVYQHLSYELFLLFLDIYSLTIPELVQIVAHILAFLTFALCNHIFQDIDL